MASPLVPVMAPAPLPPLPLLAAIPQQAAPFMSGLPLVGVVAGLLAGWYLSRRMRELSWTHRLMAAVICSAVVAGVLGVLAVLASGSLGSVRFAHLGPPAATLTGIGLLVTLVGASPVAVFAVARRRKPAIVPVPDRVSVVLVAHAPAGQGVVDPDATVGMPPIAFDDDPTMGMAPIAFDDDPTMGMAPIVVDDEPTMGMAPIMDMDMDMDMDLDLDMTAEIPAIDVAQSSHD
jgi:hypothetical protein